MVKSHKVSLEDEVKESICNKLIEFFDFDETNCGLSAHEIPKWFDSFYRCGKQGIRVWCKDCGKTHVLQWHCNKKWCPRCNWKITQQRRELLEIWSHTILQPKHLVLTQRNFDRLTPGKIKEHQQALVKLRRQKIFEPVKGGCYSVEITHEKGWHLHSHWLVDARFIPIQEISVEWGKLVGQDFAIVHISDLRDKSYLQEVLKYVVKGSEMLKWSALDIIDFVESINRKRFFFAFGSFFKMGAMIRQELKDRKEKHIMECPSCESQKLEFHDSDFIKKSIAREIEKRVESMPRLKVV